MKLTKKDFLSGALIGLVCCLVMRLVFALFIGFSVDKWTWKQMGLYAVCGFILAFAVNIGLGMYAAYKKSKKQ